mmetsp:Transcript_60526/g.132505  ORF Transcript_60526/g.132505 Transcript_60526/m.132505 type:complete len:212 (+) Transcript_60526:1965-2600(+)
MSRAAASAVATSGTSLPMNCAAASMGGSSGAAASCAAGAGGAGGAGASAGGSSAPSLQRSITGTETTGTGATPVTSPLAHSSRNAAKGSKPFSLAICARVWRLALKGAQSSSTSSMVSACSKLSSTFGVRFLPRFSATATRPRLFSKSFTRQISRSTRRRSSSDMEPVFSLRYLAIKGNVLPSWNNCTAPATQPTSSCSCFAIHGAKFREI